MSSDTRRGFLRTAVSAAGMTLASQTFSFAGTRGIRLALRMPDGPPQLDRLPREWYKAKITQVQQELDRRKLNGLLLLNATNVIYTTGYFHRSTERPLGVFIPAKGDAVMFIPGLEEDQIKLWWWHDYDTYFDFPGPVNRVKWIAEQMARRGWSSGKIGIEDAPASKIKHLHDGDPKVEFVPVDDIIEQMRWVKDDDELAVMRRSMYYADYTVKVGREYIAKNGAVTEDQILKATADALADKMNAELKSVDGVSIDPPFGGMVPFGKRSAFPHAVPSKDDRLKKGDALILSFGACVGGYNVECERAFCVGAPSDYAKRLFDAMMAAHDTAAANMKPGNVAEDVDKAGLDQIRKAGFEKFIRHRCGHGIGLDGHESPWIAEGDKTVLKENMTFSCEPGVYDPNFGGFRHSDTVVVKPNGGQILNTYPTKLEDMVIEI